MLSIREELCRFIRLNKHEEWVGAFDALEQLERFGDDLIPGLIECLEDGHPDVRHLAVQLLAGARPRSDVAVSELIERLTDEDWLVVTSTMLHLGDFGPLAVSGIPQIETWLESPNEYLRILAATTIVKLDPNRTEFVPIIRDAIMSDHPVVQSFGNSSMIRWLDNRKFHEPPQIFPRRVFGGRFFQQISKPPGMCGKSCRIRKRWSS